MTIRLKPGSNAPVLLLQAFPGANAEQGLVQQIGNAIATLGKSSCPSTNLAGNNSKAFSSQPATTV